MYDFTKCLILFTLPVRIECKKLILLSGDYITSLWLYRSFGNYFDRNKTLSPVFMLLNLWLEICAFSVFQYLLIVEDALKCLTVW